MSLQLKCIHFVVVLVLHVVISSHVDYMGLGVPYMNKEELEAGHSLGQFFFLYMTALGDGAQDIWRQGLDYKQVTHIL